MPVTTTIRSFRHSMPLPVYIAVMSSLRTFRGTIDATSTLSFNPLELPNTPEIGRTGFSEFRRGLSEATVITPESSAAHPVFSEILTEGGVVLMTPAPEGVPFLKNLQKKAACSHAEIRDLPFRTLTAAEIYFWCCREYGLMNRTWTGSPMLFLQEVCGRSVTADREDAVKEVEDAVAEANTLMSKNSDNTPHFVIELNSCIDLTGMMRLRLLNPAKQSAAAQEQTAAPSGPVIVTKKSADYLTRKLGLVPAPKSVPEDRAQPKPVAEAVSQALPAENHEPPSLIDKVWLRVASVRLHRLFRLIGALSENDQGERMVSSADMGRLGFDVDDREANLRTVMQTVNAKRICWSSSVPAPEQRGLRLCTASLCDQGLAVRSNDLLKPFFNDIGIGVSAEKLALTAGIGEHSNAPEDIAAVDLIICLLDKKAADAEHPSHFSFTAELQDVSSWLVGIDPDTAQDEQIRLLQQAVEVINRDAKLFPWHVSAEVKSPSHETARLTFTLTPTQNRRAEESLAVSASDDTDPASADKEQDLEVQVRGLPECEDEDSDTENRPMVPSGQEMLPMPDLEFLASSPARNENVFQRNNRKEDADMASENSVAGTKGGNPVRAWMDSDVNVPYGPLNYPMPLKSLMKGVPPEAFMMAFIDMNCPLDSPATFWKVIEKAVLKLRLSKED